MLMVAVSGAVVACSSSNPSYGFPGPPGFPVDAQADQADPVWVEDAAKPLDAGADPEGGDAAPDAGADAGSD